jgi:hypothetical protein
MYLCISVNIQGSEGYFCPATLMLFLEKWGSSVLQKRLSTLKFTGKGLNYEE